MLGGFYGSKSDAILKRKLDMLIEEGVVIDTCSSKSNDVVSKMKVSKSCVCNFD